MASKKRDERVRNWVFILYPESAPEDWKERLQEMCIPCAISPLHDRDLNPDGEKKKAHYHIMIMFDGNKSYEQIKEITDSFNASIPQKVMSVRGQVRYFCHLDNPEKYQYSEKEIITYGGIDTSELLKKSASYRYSTIQEMYDFVKDNEITEITKLLDYCKENGLEDWFVMLADGQATIVKEAVKSFRHQKKDKDISDLYDMISELRQSFDIYKCAKPSTIYGVYIQNVLIERTSDFNIAMSRYKTYCVEHPDCEVEILTID